MNYQNIAVVGCNGFIGKALTERLIRNKELNLFLFGRNQQSSFAKEFAYSSFDLANPAVQAQFKNIDLVYYLISETIPATSWDNPLLEVQKNLVPFLQFMELAARQQVKKVVFVSSAGTIYGPSEKKVTETADKQPFSPYGITKLSMEHYLNYFEKKYGILHDIYRVSNVYGKGQNTAKGLGIINTFIEKIIQEKKITIFGDGKNVRNYIYIDDVAEMLMLSLRQKPASEIYNLSSDDTLSINELVSLLKEVLSEPFDVQYTPVRQSDNSAIVPDNTKIKKAMPEYRLVTIKEGLKETYQYLKQTLSPQDVKNQS